MSQTWASELEETGVRVNWVDPGNMNTAMHRAAEPEEDPNEWANPADVTDVFLFLASEESKDISGKRFQAQEDWKAVLHHEEHEGHEVEKNYAALRGLRVLRGKPNMLISEIFSSNDLTGVNRNRVSLT